MNRIFLPARLRTERGQALVEFALITPILLLLVFGIVTLGWTFLQYNQVIHATREGARYAAICPGAIVTTDGVCTETIAERVDTAATVFVVSTGDLADNPPPGHLWIAVSHPNGNTPGEPVQVRGKATIRLLVAPVIGFAGDSFTVHTEAVMRIE